MSPTKCSYYHCNNTTRDFSMFRFPRDQPRLNIWLRNCGNSTITHLPKNKLRHKYVCIAHFDSKYIVKKRGLRQRIWRSAIPRQRYKDAPLCRPEPIPPKPQDSEAKDERTEELKVLIPKKVYSRPALRKGPLIKIEKKGESKVNFETFLKQERSEEDTPRCNNIELSIGNGDTVATKRESKYNPLERKITNCIYEDYSATCKQETTEAVDIKSEPGSHIVQNADSRVTPEELTEELIIKNEPEFETESQLDFESETEESKPVVPEDHCCCYAEPSHNNINNTNNTVSLHNIETVNTSGGSNINIELKTEIDVDDNIKIKKEHGDESSDTCESDYILSI